MNYYLKAIYGAVSAALGSLTVVLLAQEAIPGQHGHVTIVEWLGVAGSALLAFGAVFGVTNTPPAPPAPPAV